MSTTGFTFGGGQITGTPTDADKEVALARIAEENARRAALTPPGAVLPTSTNVEIRNSYEQYWAYVQLQAHLGWMPVEAEKAMRTDLGPRWQISSNAQRLAALAALQPLP